MTNWIIKVVGKRHRQIDKHLLVQAVLALSRQLKQDAQAKQATETPTVEGEA